MVEDVSRPIDFTRKRIEVAHRIASKFGDVIGFTSRVKPVEVMVDKKTILVEIPFNEYLKSINRGYYFPIGSFIGILNPLTLTVFLGRIRCIGRSDILAEARIPAPTTSPVDVFALTTPLRIEVELISECKVDENGEFIGEVTPVYTPVDPQSPVFKPRNEFIERMLSLPISGIRIGKLYVSGIEYDVDIRLPENILYQHLLIVGTTGSGKTVLLKNMALAVNQDLSNRDPLTLIFDLQGDYLHLVLENPDVVDRKLSPLDQLTIILPVTRSYVENILDKLSSRIKGFNDLYVFIDEYFYEFTKDFIENTFHGVKFRYNPVYEVKDHIVIVRGVEVELDVPEGVKKLNVIPWALQFSEVCYEVRDLIPIITPQAYNFLPMVLDYLSAKKNKIDGVLMLLSKSINDISKKLNLHKETLNHMYRCLAMIFQTGLIDVHINVRVNDELYGLLFTEPNYEDLFVNSNVIVVDLRFSSLYSKSQLTETVIVYRILNKLFKWKDEAFMKGVESKPVFILIDEAHNYFPQARGEINKDIVEYLINRITRLGRVRGIGVVFATHRPSDLNDLIIQLANTKIGLRCEEKVLDRIGLREFKGELEYAPDGVGVVKSPAFKTHYVMFRGYEPQTYHRKFT